MAAIMLNAATIAYRKAITKTREKVVSNPDVPPWMVILANECPENESAAAAKPLSEATRHYKERVLKNSVLLYNRVAWFAFDRIVTQNWFESLVMLSILMIGVATGVDLENGGRDAWTVAFVDIVAIFSTVVFTVECVVKIVSEGMEPWKYFTDEENGSMNAFDFSIVVANFAFLGNSTGSAIGALRMLRLVRLLTFIKGVPQLRVIIAGLIQGVKSVVYIVMLLFLVMYLFAILGTLLLGINDPANFGHVRLSMITLFQVSTLTSWSSIAYVSWFGCSNYLKSPYANGEGFFGNPSRIFTLGDSVFEGFRCDEHSSNTQGSPILTAAFFSVYILFTAWVIMSLFIGVISMGMFESFLKMKEELGNDKIEHSNEVNTTMEYPGVVPIMKDRIDKCLSDKLEALAPASTPWGIFVEQAGSRAKLIRDSDLFGNFITVAIMVVGVMIGVDTDFTMRCERMYSRLDYEDPAESDETSQLMELRENCHHGETGSQIVTLVAQIVFTLEMVVKLLAEGNSPLVYFTDEEDGSWNSLDFLIVWIGFAEMTPAAFIFEEFPVVVLRLLRLLRVFRLAKTLPRLRRIVEALISGFSAVGWICILIVVFDYIVACMCMLAFQTNDPFHFGSVGRAMFTVLRIETLDSWDEVLRISMYGCKGYPAGYDYTLDNPKMTCKEDHDFAWGWMGAIILFAVAIMGAYVLPTVLVGIISIKFDEASRHIEKANEEKTATEKVVKAAREYLPNYFTDDRLRALRELYNMMDANGELTLDIVEVAPFLHYTFDELFGLQMNTLDVEHVFHLMDMSKNTDVGFHEFVHFISIIKGLDYKCQQEPEFAERVFGQSYKRVADKDRGSWNEAMRRVDAEATGQAWDAILLAIKGDDGEDAIEKIRNVFKDFDSDSSMQLDQEELGSGLRSIGVIITDRQLRAFIRSTDMDGDMQISCKEFIVQIQQVQDRMAAENVEKAAQEAQALIKQVTYQRSKVHSLEADALPSPSLLKLSKVFKGPKNLMPKKLMKGFLKKKNSNAASFEFSSKLDAVENNRSVDIPDTQPAPDSISTSKSPDKSTTDSGIELVGSSSRQKIVPHEDIEDMETKQELSESTDASRERSKSESRSKVRSSLEDGKQLELLASFSSSKTLPSPPIKGEEPMEEEEASVEENESNYDALQAALSKIAELENENATLKNRLSKVESRKRPPSLRGATSSLPPRAAHRQTSDGSMDRTLGTSI